MKVCLGKYRMSVEYKEYDNPKEMLDYYSEWSKDINDNKDHRILAIENYCGFVHEKINGYMRGLAKLGPFSDYLDTIQTLFSSSPLLPNNTILYRALPLCVIEKMQSEIKTNGFYVDRGYLSTSLNLNGISNIKDYPHGKIECVLRLYVSKGVPALYIEDIKGSGMGRGELEVILPRNLKIKMIRSPYKDMRFGYNIYDTILEYDVLNIYE